MTAGSAAGTPDAIAPEIAIVVLFDREGRVLMQHRTDDAPIAPGLWTPPGGHLEPGEDPLGAAHRELYEETGLRVDALTPHRVVEQRGHDGVFVRYHTYTAITAASQSDVVLGEGQAMVFLSPQEIASLELTLIAARILPELLDGHLT